MSLFSKIGKGIANVAKKVGSAVKSAGPALAGVAGLAAGIALPGIGGAVSKGVSSLVSKTGGKVKGSKMSSAVDQVLNSIDPQAAAQRKGIFGIGDGKPGLFGIGDGLPGIFGIGTGKGKAKRAIEAGQTYDEYERQSALRGIDPNTGEPVKSGLSPLLLGLLGIGGFMLLKKK